MAVRERDLASEEDLSAMVALARAFPTAHPHVVDLPYRLSSWALDDSRNVRLWVDDEGSVVAWVCLQPPFWAIDCVCRPDIEAALYRELVAWAVGRARDAVAAGGVPASGT